MHIAFSKNGLSLLIAVILALATVGVFYPNATGQTSEPMSRAEQEAEQQVSLSPEKIIEVLRDEPGLLLQLKKLLVRQAFADGRILNASDLNDDALFRLLWEDENARVLATREIEDRDYIRAKPTHEEIEQEQDLAAQRGLSRVSMPELFSDQPTAETNRPVDGQQEGAYWNKREQDLQNNQRIRDRRANPNTLQPEPFSPDAQPDIPQRQLNRASSRQTSDDYVNDGYTDIEARGQSHASRPSFANSVFTSSSSATPDFSSLNFAGQATSTQELPDLRGGSSSLQSRSLGTRSGSDALTGNGGLLNDSDEAGSSQSPQSYRAGRSVNALDARLDNSWRKFSPREFGNSNGNNDESRSIIRHQPNPYANVPSLYDLYTQVSRKSSVPERFGIEIFRNGTGNLDNLPMDLPVGPEYVLGPGDGLNIELWGGIAQRLQRVIDREGRVALPEVGSIAVSGRPLGEAQRIVQSVLRTQFHDVEADVSLARIRSVRVYVVGDVVSPGAYDISSLSSPLNALYAAGGPTARGSLRHLQQFRGKTLVQTIDVYDLLLHGIHTEMARIESGDTILVPSVGPQVTVQGMVRRPAIYEIDGENSLAKILELAGGVLSSGTLRHVDVERVIAIDKYMYLNVNTPILDDAIRVQYNQTELVRHVDDVQHTLAREALRYFHIDNGIEIVSVADIPAGTGLGSSSCYLVGLLNAMHSLTQTPISPERLAEEACQIELDRLHKPIGKQDQYMAAFGGLTALHIDKDGRVKASRLCLSVELLEALESNMLLFYTGAARDTVNILEKQDSDTKKKNGVVVDSLCEIKNIGIDIRDAIMRGNLHRFGELLDVHWQTKKRLSGGISNLRIDGWYELAKQNGAIGGKICGAGGGGFLMLYCEEKKPQLRDAMRHAGLRELNFRFEFEGSKVVFDMVSRDGRLAHIQRQEKNHHFRRAAALVAHA